MTEQKGLHSPRCLLTVAVNRLKGILKSNILVCLTPFACRSGQTSSMLGGAQFKATLFDQKALFSNIQCKMTDSNSWQTRVDGKQLPAASDVNRDLPLPAQFRTEATLGRICSAAGSESILQSSRTVSLCM